jgi:tRNA/tmRNA/rRNA uracil-C5-methylase (TrmA/RlmC/RlmD family)
VADCPITVPGALGGVLARTWRPGDEVEVVRDAEGGTHVTQLPPSGVRPGGARAKARARPRQVTGGPVVVEHAVGRDWRLATHGFWQVHPSAADTLAEVVGQWAQAPSGGVAWDLYGGVGLFAAVLAGQVGARGEVLVVEASRRAVADGAANLADLPQVRLRAGRVESVLADPELAGTRPDVVVLDPPRKGAGRAVVDAVAGRAPARVVYVACDPAALARDVAAFAGHGYTLSALRAFDAFPMTHHVECVALLTTSSTVEAG